MLGSEAAGIMEGSASEAPGNHSCYCGCLTSCRTSLQATETPALSHAAQITDPSGAAQMEQHRASDGQYDDAKYSHCQGFLRSRGFRELE